MGVLKRIPQKAVPAPLCQCECRACDIGIHCSKQSCGHRAQRIAPNVTSRRPVASAPVPFASSPRKKTGTLAYTLPFESPECSSRTR
jgi:hypothetical protein